MYKRFDYLPNKALILDVQDDIVLCAWNGQYVTWRVDNAGSCYWGHYHGDNLESAFYEYKARTKK